MHIQNLIMIRILGYLQSKIYLKNSFLRHILAYLERFVMLAYWEPCYIQNYVIFRILAYIGTEAYSESCLFIRFFLPSPFLNFKFNSSWFLYYHLLYIMVWTRSKWENLSKEEIIEDLVSAEDIYSKLSDRTSHFYEDMKSFPLSYLQVKTVTTCLLKEFSNWRKTQLIMLNIIAMNQ